MSTARIKKTIPNTNAKVQKTLDEINKEFKIEMTQDEGVALKQIHLEQTKKLVHYPQIETPRVKRA